MTYETGERPGEFVVDIFDPKGVLILRKPIRAYHDFTGIFLKVRDGRLYVVQEKETGEKLFKAFRMIWK